MTVDSIVRGSMALLLFALALYAFCDARVSARRSRATGDERHALMAVCGYFVSGFCWAALMGFVGGLWRG